MVSRQWFNVERVFWAVYKITIYFNNALVNLRGNFADNSQKPVITTIAQQNREK